MNRKYISLKNFFLLFFSTSYVFGFLLRENIAGGAEDDFLNFTWPVIISFKQDFLYTIENYGSFGEGSFPLFHIINAYLNPFSFNQIYFQASIAVISTLNVIVFSQIIEEKFKLKKIDAILYSSIFLILPFFRSSAFWGITENFGWLFLLLSIKYYNLTNQTNKNEDIKFIFLTCLFSSMALYIRPYLIFFPIFVVIKSLIFKELRLLKFFVLFYLIFSIPGLQLIYVWEGIFKIGDDINLMQDYHNPKFVLKNLPIFFSLFLFYFLPFELCQKFKSNKKDIIYFIIFFSILLILNHLGYLDYLKSIELGGGIFLKLNNILFKDNLFFFLAVSSLGIVKILKYYSLGKKNTILFICLLIFCFPKFILQEYLEPLFLIVLFTLIDLKKNQLELFNQKNTIFTFCSYFSIYYIGSFLYRYFYI
tara:strand:+ start:6138 stop:7400 length:1263 start_codon:yes stop_codon:yes gene_type:complete